jgi:extradiol dioxygenase family protein
MRLCNPGTTWSRLARLYRVRLRGFALPTTQRALLQRPRVAQKGEIAKRSQFFLRSYAAYQIEQKVFRWIDAA